MCRLILTTFNFFKLYDKALHSSLTYLLSIADKQRRLRLVLSGAIEGMNYDKIRVAEPKSGVNLLTHGWSRGRTAYLLCAAGGSGGVWVYEIVREATRHRRLLELTPPSSTTAGSHIHAICLVRDGDALAVGLESAFIIHNIWAHGSVNGKSQEYPTHSNGEVSFISRHFQINLPIAGKIKK